MDVKMGLRTFTEEDAHSTKPRRDLFDKMLRVAPDAATEEEIAANGIVKLRYLQFREQSTSSRTLGFRVDAVQLADECDTSGVPSPHELRLVATREQVRCVIAQYLQRRRELLMAFVRQLRKLRSTLEACAVFRTHTFIRSSILFVYDAVSHRPQLRIIDLPKTSAAGLDANGQPLTLNHRSVWREENHEDGYLTGLDNLVNIFDELLAAEMPAE